MKIAGKLLLASASAVFALGAASWLSFLLLLQVDPHYHDGFAAFGGFVIGLLLAVLVFRAVWRYRAISA